MSVPATTSPSVVKIPATPSAAPSPPDNNPSPSSFAIEPSRNGRSSSTGWGTNADPSAGCGTKVEPSAGCGTNADPSAGLGINSAMFYPMLLVLEWCIFSRLMYTEVPLLPRLRHLLLYVRLSLHRHSQEPLPWHTVGQGPL